MKVRFVAPQPGSDSGLQFRSNFFLGLHDLLVYGGPPSHDVIKTSREVSRRARASAIPLPAGRVESLSWQPVDKRPDAGTHEVLPPGLIQIVF